MAHLRMTTDTADAGDLRKLAEEVRASGTPRLLVSDGEEVAMLVPVHGGTAPSPGTQFDQGEPATDLQDFLSAAGSWKGHIDPDEFMVRVREGRSSNRPVVSFPNGDE